MQKETLNRRLYKKHEVLQPRNTLVVRHAANKSTERDTVNLNKYRSNSSVRLPSLEKVRPIVTTITPNQTQSTHNLLPANLSISDRYKSNIILTARSSVLDISRIENSQVAGSLRRRSLGGITPRNNKLPTNQTITHLLKIGVLTIPKLITLLNTSYNEEFVYLRPLGLYEYQAITFEEKGTNYITISCNGVLIEDQLVSLDQWMHEQSNYNQLRKLQLWKNYVTRKVFRHWKNTMRKHYKAITSQKLMKYSPMASVYSVLEMLRVREECLKMSENYQIFEVKLFVMSDFIAYKTAQEEWVGKLVKKIVRWQDKIEQLILSICFEALKQYPLVFDTKESLNKTVPLIENVTMRFDVKSAMRITIEKLYRLVRTVDLHLMEALGKLVINSLTQMAVTLTNKTGIFQTNTIDLLKVDPSLSKEDYQRRRNDFISEDEFFNWISFNLSIGIQDTLKLTPSLLDVNSYINDHIAKVIQAIAKFKKPLIMARRFEFIRKNIKDVMESLQDKSDSHTFTFTDYLNNNNAYEIALHEFNYSIQNFIEYYNVRITTFQPFLNLYKKFDVSRPMPDLTFVDILQCMEDLQKDYDDLEKLQDGEYILYGFVSNSQFKCDVLDRLNNYKQRLMQYIPNQFLHQIVTLKSTLNNHRTVFDTLINSSGKFVLVLREASIFEERLGKYQTTIDDLKRIAVLYERAYKIQLFGCNELMNLMNVVRSRLTTFISNRDANLIRYRKELEQSYKDLEKQVARVQAILADSKYYEECENPEEIYLQLQNIGNKIEKMLSNLEQIIDFMSVLSLQAQRLHKLEFLWNQFSTMKNVWEVFVGWKQLQDSTSTIQVMSADLTDFQTHYNLFSDRIGSQIKKNDKYELAHRVKKRLDELQNEILLLECLHSKYLRSKDWDEFYSLLHKNLGIQAGQGNSQNPLLTLSFLRENKVISLIREVCEIVAKAKKQIEIVEMLNRFQYKWWPNIRLQTVQYDGTLFIFTDNEQVRRDIQENMMMLLSIMNNKYGGFARHRCQTLLRNLNNLIKLLEELLIYQGNFIELYPILSSSFCEKQLPLEYKQYQKIVVSTMRQMKILINPIKGLTGETTMTLLTHNNKQFENIHRKLSTFMERKRLQFQRFYFLEDREMMELLAGLAKDSSLHRMFEGITGWYQQDNIIVGVTGNGGEHLRLLNWLFKNQQLQLMFKHLEEGIHYTLKTLVRQTLSAYQIELKNLYELQTKIPWICTYTVEWILYCKQMEINYFCNTNDISLQLHLLSTNLHELLQNPGLNSNLITLTLHMIHLTRELQHHHVTHVLDYHWQSVIRFYYEDDVVIRSLGGTFEWGGEYQGVWQVMVNTKDIRRAYASVLGGLNWGIGVCMQGPSGTGKTETLKELARSMAKLCLVFNCSSLVSTKLLQKLLSGLCYTGSWICLDEINRLEIEVMSVVASQISVIRNAVGGKKEHFSFFGKEIALRQGIGIFSTMNPNYANRTELTENLKCYFRCVSVNLPEYEKIIEVMLYSKGFREAAEMSSRICKLYQLLSVQFNEQKHYDFGLRGMKNLMLLIDKHRNLKIAEEATIRTALYENLKPRLTQTDLVIFQKTVADIFPIQIEKSLDLQRDPLEEKYQAIVEATQIGIIVLGETSCKTTLIERYIRESASKTRRFNPNSMDVIYFFGGKLQSGWQIGVVQEILKESINDHKMKYVLYLDGQVRSEWVENFNTLLDDTKVFSLPNGTRLKQSEGNFRMIIETPDLLMASPATITRCSIIYTSSNIISLKMFIDQQLSKTKFPPDLVQELEQLFLKLTKEEVRSVMYMLPSLMPKQLLTKEEDWMYNESLGVQRIAVYLIALIGSYDKIKSLLIKELIPVKLPLTKYFISFQKYPEGDYVLFDPQREIQSVSTTSLFIPNLNSSLCAHIIQRAVQGRFNILIKGIAGSGKSRSIRYAIERLTQPHSQVMIHVTQYLKSVTMSLLLEGKYQIERKNEREEELVPLEGDRTIVFVDNVALANNQSSEFLRAFLERKTHMQLKTLEERKVRDTSVIAQANRKIDPRLQSHMFPLEISLTSESLHSIYLKLFTVVIGLTNLSEFVKNELEGFFTDKFVRVLVGFTAQSNVLIDGYAYGMRQLSQLANSLSLLNSQGFKNTEHAVTMILYQLARVYYDRLPNDNIVDKTKIRFQKAFSDNFNKRYATELDRVNRKNQPLVFSSLLNHGENRELSSDFNQELTKLENLLNKSEIRVIVPKFVLVHLCRIIRVHDIPSTNCIWIGPVGSGKLTILQIAAKVTATEVAELPKKATDHEIVRFLFECIKKCASSRKQLYLYAPCENISPSTLALMESIQAGDISVLNEDDRNYAFDHVSEVYGNTYDRKAKTVEQAIVDYIKSGLRLLKVILTIEKRKFQQLKAYPDLFNSCYINSINEWPDAALEEFSNKILQTSNEKRLILLKEKLVKLSVDIFVKLKELNDIYNHATRQQLEVSPIQHIKFIRTYLKVLANQQAELKAHQEKFSKSILKMGETDVLLRQMKNKIVEMEPQLKIKKEQLQLLMPGLELRKLQAAEVKKVVERDQNQVELKKTYIESLKNQAQQSLREAEPLLTEAANSVATIKRSQLSEIKSNNNPNKLVLFTLENVSMLLGDSANWESIKKILSDTELLYRLKNCTPKYDDYLKVRKRISQHPEWTLENIEKVSVSCKALAKWVINVGKFCEINVIVDKQKAELNDLKKDLIESEYILKATQQRSQAANDKLMEVQRQFKKTSDLINGLQQQIQLNKDRLVRAGFIQTGLGDSVERWKQTINQLDLSLVHSVTESLFMAAMLQLSPCYPGEVRDSLLYFMKERARSLKLVYNEGFSILDLFDPLERQNWQKNGLSSDLTSMQNATFLMYHINKYPIIIDPDNQATNWLQKHYEYTQTKSTLIGVNKEVERAIRNGHKLVLLIDRQLDELAVSIIEAKIEAKGSRKMMQMGNAVFELDERFRLLLCTKEKHPKFSSGLRVRHPIVNFSVTRKAMESQLIIELLKQENDEIYNEKLNLEMTRLNNKTKLASLQTQILDTLADNKGGLLEDDSIVTLLHNSSKTVHQIAVSAETLQAKNTNLKLILTNYQKLCEIAAMIYINLGQLNRVNPMLNWNYSFFIKTFLVVCLESVSEQVNNTSDILDFNDMGEEMYESFVFSNANSTGQRPTSSLSRMSSRLSNRSKSYSINNDDQLVSPNNYRSVPQDNHNQLANQIYRKPERVLDETKKGRMDEDRLKVVIAVLLGKIKAGLEESDRKLLGLLLSLDKVKKVDINVLFQCSVKRDSVKAYAQMNHFTQQLRTFDEQIKGSPEHYNSIVNAENPFEVDLRLTPFSCLILTRMLRPDRFGEILDKFIAKEGFEQLLTSADFNIFEVFKQLDSMTPALFIMGDDPLNKIIEFLLRRKVMKHTLVISMGEGQTIVAEKALEKEYRRQTILILHNLHISPSIYPNITRILEQLEMYSAGLNSKFRLIMIMKPSKLFPSAISGRCLKITLEPPSGIKNKMMQLLRNNYNMIADEDDSTRAVAYAITLFHAIISDRAKFGPVGWNVPYQYTEMEYQNSLRILKQVVSRATNPNCVKCNIDEIDEIQELLDFQALRNLIGGINYEGRITDELDRAKLKVLTDQFLSADVLASDFKFMGLKSYPVPKSFTFEEMMEHVNQIKEDPSIFGLNSAQQPSSNIPTEILKQVQRLFFEDTSATKDAGYLQQQQELPLTGHILGLVDIEIQEMNKQPIKSIIPFQLLKSITVNTRVFDLKAFKQPRKFISDIKKEYAIKNNVEFEAVMLSYSFVAKQECFGISNLTIQAGKINNNLLEEGLLGICPILYIVPSFRKKDKNDKILPEQNKEVVHGQQKVKIPLYKNQMRQGQINSFGENVNLIAMVQLLSRKGQEVWTLRGTALLLSNNI